MIKLERLTETAQEPTYGSDHAACFDIRADIEGREVTASWGDLTDASTRNSIGEAILYPDERILIPTGFVFHIPEGYQLKINPRSGLAWRSGITVLNAPATIDSDYKGELFVVLYNTSGETFTINHGDRIAQAELMPAIRCDFESLGERKGGFGSSGKS
jgi:dUTP pyrophosphatase